jgi:hypothetical protein
VAGLPQKQTFWLSSFADALAAFLVALLAASAQAD